MSDGQKQLTAVVIISLVAWIFSAGMLFQRVADIKEQVSRIEGVLDKAFPKLEAVK